ncbi:hypothetical protein [Flexithrix dorotheae]|uniref:hypothetical protein n=1 Tax=Flexithrix dorotheae TaxID=70993 RepID=UPI0003711A1D|nr:hypothetical protein [Flexithrix dorotheae]
MKKIPSLTRLPDHRRFNYDPRYYDPIKEEIEAKENSMRNALNGKDGSEKIKERISGSFKRKSNESKKSFIIQALIAVLLGVIVFALLT